MKTKKTFSLFVILMLSLSLLSSFASAEILPLTSGISTDIKNLPTGVVISVNQFGSSTTSGTTYQYQKLADGNWRRFASGPTVGALGGVGIYKESEIVRYITQYSSQNSLLTYTIAPSTITAAPTRTPTPLSVSTSTKNSIIPIDSVSLGIFGSDVVSYELLRAPNGDIYTRSASGHEQADLSLSDLFRSQTDSKVVASELAAISRSSNNNNQASVNVVASTNAGSPNVNPTPAAKVETVVIAPPTVPAQVNIAVDTVKGLVDTAISGSSIDFNNNKYTLTYFADSDDNRLWADDSGNPITSSLLQNLLAYDLQSSYALGVPLGLTFSGLQSTESIPYTSLKLSKDSTATSQLMSPPLTNQQIAKVETTVESVIDSALKTTSDSSAPTTASSTVVATNSVVTQPLTQTGSQLSREETAQMELAVKLALESSQKIRNVENAPVVDTKSPGAATPIVDASPQSALSDEEMAQYGTALTSLIISQFALNPYVIVDSVAQPTSAPTALPVPSMDNAFGKVSGDAEFVSQLSLKLTDGQLEQLKFDIANNIKLSPLLTTKLLDPKQNTEASKPAIDSNTLNPQAVSVEPDSNSAGHIAQVNDETETKKLSLSNYLDANFPDKPREQKASGSNTNNVVNGIQQNLVEYGSLKTYYKADGKTPVTGVFVANEFYAVNAQGKLANVGIGGVTVSADGKSLVLAPGFSDTYEVPVSKETQDSFAIAGVQSGFLTYINGQLAALDKSKNLVISSGDYAVVYSAKSGDIISYKSADGYTVTVPKKGDEYVLTGPEGKIKSFKNEQTALSILPIASGVIPIYQEYGLLAQLDDPKSDSYLFDALKSGEPIQLGKATSDRSVQLSISKDTQTKKSTFSTITKIGTIAGQTASDSSEDRGYVFTTATDYKTGIKTVVTELYAGGGDLPTKTTTKMTADGKVYSTEYASSNGKLSTYSLVSKDPSVDTGYFIGDPNSGVYVATNGKVYRDISFADAQDQKYSADNIVPNVKGGPGGIKVDTKSFQKEDDAGVKSAAEEFVNGVDGKGGIKKEIEAALNGIHDATFTTSLEVRERQIQQRAATYGLNHGLASFALLLNDFSKESRDWSGFSSLFAGNKAIQEWKLKIDQTFQKFTSAGWVESICAKKFKQPAQSTAFVKIPGGSITPAATVAAECTPVWDSLSGNTTRMYKFTVHVTNPQSTDAYAPPMAFNVNLFGSQDIALFTEKKELQRGESFTLDKDKQPVLSSELYDKICISFDEPPEFFKGTQVCNKIVCHDELTQSGYDSLPTSADIYVTISQKQAAQGTAAVETQANVTSLLNPGI